MILSRLPVQQVLRIALPWPSDPAVRSMPRLLLDAIVQAPFGPLRVMTTHLEYYSPTQRAAQVEALRARHAEACAHARHDRVADTSHSPFHGQPHTPSAVLVGDFNFRPEDALHARMLAPFDGADAPAFLDAWQVLNGELPHAHTNGVHDRVQWPEPYTCDFVFVSEDLRDRIRALRVDAQTQASDHQPVLIELG
jgi:endonuclease/exonuclease/phosphatase family metal-dependent hydrolase